MNKLTILIIAVIFFGFYANPAFAVGVLSNSDFFYGETIDNTVEVINASHLQATAGISTQPIELSASEFFYGDS
ncbi:MAG: hypothetical protein PF482_03860, partial [Desulfobacteraceae bacterium]|nr:hypothetical protein [Desulfobacteraceae bacterium]